MKILFVLGNVYPHDDANSILIERLATELHKLDGATSIIELGLSDNVGGSTCSEHRGIKVYELGNTFQSRISGALNEFLKSICAYSRNERFQLFLKNPGLMLEYIYMRILYGNISKNYKKGIRRICHDELVDIVVCVSYPFEACIATARMRMRVPFIYYQLDPYFNHYQQKWKLYAQKREDFVCRKASHVVMTKLIHEDYFNSKLKHHFPKCSILEFPSIRPVPLLQDNDVIHAKTDKESFYRFLFLGSVYSDIRSPDYCYALFHQVIEKYPGIIIDFVGPIYGNLSTAAKHLEGLLGSNFRRHERVSADAADKLLSGADFLINIGNTVHNQMPSKIFEYISTGKPILNFYKMDNCPTLNYTEKYPLCMNVSEARSIDDDLVDEFLQFCTRNYGKRLTYNQVEAIFSECTVESVGKRFSKIVESVIHKK